jgi:hypothetical protein
MIWRSNYQQAARAQQTVEFTKHQMDISNLGHDFAAKDYIEGCVAMREAMGGSELDGLDSALRINLVCPLERYW